MRFAGLEATAEIPEPGNVILLVEQNSYTRSEFPALSHSEIISGISAHFPSKLSVNPQQSMVYTHLLLKL